METRPEITTTPITVRPPEKKDAAVLEMPKLVPVSDPKPPALQTQQQQSILRKAAATPATSARSNYIKILPKSTLPIKAIQGPNGKIILQAPPSKIVSVQIKSSTNPSTTVPAALSLLPLTLPMEAKAAISKLSGVTLIQTSKSTPKETITTTPKQQAIITTAISSITSTTVSSLVASKSLEIKPITVTNSPKALTPAQAATTPITGTNLLSKLIAVKSDSRDGNESVTIEKKNVTKALPMKAYTIKNDTIVTKISPTVPGNRMINLQISNGKLSDPNGPIKMISASSNSAKDKITEKPNQTGNEPKATEILPTREKTPENSTTKGLIRLKSLEPLAQNNKNKIKQQSLLKNKTIEQLQRSPRTKGRSKSLTFSELGLNSKKRRLSVASDSAIQKTDGDKSASISPPPPKDKTPPAEAQVKNLLCPEKISASSDSLVSTSPVEDKIVSVPVNYANSDVIEMNSSDEEYKPISDSGRSTVRSNENEIYNCLKWSNGIGLLRDSKLQFQFNEFGLIEIIDGRQKMRDIEMSYEKPIFEREMKSQKTLDYSDPYFCKGCNCKGAAVDFFTPDFCSHECIKRFSRQTTTGLTARPPKKYANRKKIMLNRSDEMNPEPSKPQIPKQSFTWDTYLLKCKSEPTPIDLFLNPFPCGPNMFLVGMKLEAIDPEHSSLFCVCSIVEKRGYRLKLHFDGYAKFYDFWVNADSMDIFPPGWCAKTNRSLQPPKGISPLSFNWPMYLNRTKSIPAPRNLFTHLNSSSHSKSFKVGMKIEADDLRNTGKVCVASIADILDNRLLIHFDGWDDSYNYWIDTSSPFIHPVNWHKKNGFSIVPPPDWQDRFTWRTYLIQTKSEPATEEFFTTRDPIDFKAGMKLEVVDKRNPALIRPASVVMTDDYEIKVLFDGWSKEYSFWIEDDSPDIHPIGWCEITDHELEMPPEYGSLPTRYDCEIPGCRGFGNAKHPELNMHTNIMSCPYEPSNWSKEIDRSGRLKDTNRYGLDSNLKPKDGRNKRKAEPVLPPAIIAKQMKPQQHELQKETAQQQPQPIKKESTGISLLAPKVEQPDKNLDTRVNIARHLLCDYGPRLQQVYSLWKRNSECLTVNLPENQGQGKNPLEWSCTEVAEYISQLPRCQTITQEFIRQDIDGAAFLSMRQIDLTELLKIKLGPAIKIYNQIIQLREDVVTRFLNNSSKVS